MAGENSQNQFDLELGESIQNLSVGQFVFNRYSLVKSLGRGRTSALWQAWDDKESRDVVLKFLPEMLLSQPDAVAAIKAAVDAVKGLHHPQIAPIYGIEEDEKLLAIVTEPVEGESLHVLRQKRRNQIFDAVDLKEWLRQITETLGTVHQGSKLAHGNLKPTNIIVTAEGKVWLVDFAVDAKVGYWINKIDGTNKDRAGGLRYASPQMAEGAEPSPSDDVYSLGVCIYELLTSKPPFHSGNILAQVREDVPPSMTRRRRDLRIVGEPIPKAWDDTVASCLAKEPENRPDSMAQLLDMLEGKVEPKIEAKGATVASVAAPVAPISKKTTETLSETPEPEMVPPTATTTGLPPQKAEKTNLTPIIAIVGGIMIGLIGWYLMNKPSGPGGTNVATASNTNVSVASTEVDTTAIENARYQAELARKKAEEEAKRLAEEVEKRKAAEAASLAAAEKARQEAEAKKRAAEEERKRLEAQMAEIRRKEAELKAAEERALKEEAEKRAAMEAEAKRLAQELAAQKAKEAELKAAAEKARLEAEAKMKAELEAAQKRAALEAERIAAEKQLAAAAETQKAKAREEEAKRLELARLEAERKRKIEEARQREAESAMRMAALEQERKRLAEEEKARKEAAARREAEEKARLEREQQLKAQMAFVSMKPQAGQAWYNSLGMKMVPVGDLFVCAWECRVQDFDNFVTARRYSANSAWKSPGFAQTPVHPVVNVSYDDAQAFCQWLTEKERSENIISPNQAYRLPTDLEWSKLAGLEKEAGSTPKDRNEGVKDVFPWGNNWPPPLGAGNYYDIIGCDRHENTAPVASFMPNRFGLYDMGGNVWEWCQDWADASNKTKVARGGGWFSFIRNVMLTSHREMLSPQERKPEIGFRVVLAPVQ